MTSYTINILRILYRYHIDIKTTNYIYSVQLSIAMITDTALETIENENTILRNQVKFLMECIKNQMTNLEMLCKNTATNFINKEHLKPYYEKIYKCNILL